MVRPLALRIVLEWTNCESQAGFAVKLFHLPRESRGRKMVNAGLNRASDRKRSRDMADRGS
jgi:hypothetical protein